MYLLPYLPAVVGTPRGISKDNTRRDTGGHSSAPFYERLAHHATHVAESPRFQMSCVLCRDSLQGVSSVNLECCFVWVWPQRQTFVRILLQSRIAHLLRADVRRFLQELHAPQHYHRLRNGRLTRPCRGALRIQSRDRNQVEHPA